MKTKSVLFFTASFLALTLASCGQGDNHTPGAATSESIASVTSSASKSETSSTPSSSATSTATSDAGSTEKTTIEGLSVFTYGRFMDADNVKKIRDDFDAYCDSLSIEVTGQIWAGDDSSKVADFDAAVQAYNEEQNNPKIDIILGAKGNLGAGTYVGDHFTALTRDDATDYVTMSTYVGEEEKTERRIYIANDSAHLEAVKLLVKSAANYDMEEEPETSSESSSVTPVESSEESTESSSAPVESSEESTESSETSVTSSEESSESAPTTLDQLTVFCYKNAVTEEQMRDLSAEFDAYLSTNDVTITNLNWVLDITGKMADLSTGLETYDTEHPTATVDIILGARASFTTDYCKERFVYSPDDATGRMTIGSSSNRLIAYNKNSSNGEAITLLMNCFLPNYDFNFNS